LASPYHFPSSLLGTLRGPGFPRSITVRRADGTGPGCAGDVDGITHRGNLPLALDLQSPDQTTLQTLSSVLPLIIQPTLDDLDEKLEIVFINCF